MKRLDYFNNIGGLNLTDSPFVVSEQQATDGYNFEYLKTGSIRKVLGFQKLNSSADTQTRAKGLGIYNPVSGSMQPLRAAGTKLQKVNISTGGITDVSEDTLASNSDFFTASTQPVVFKNFSTSSADYSIFTGAGSSYVYAYVGAVDKVTKIGAATPTGTMTLSAGGSGGTIPTGTYFYALALKKTSTDAVSNASLDKSQAVTLGQKVTVTFPAVSDTTKYDTWVIYRSAAGGVTEFTTGDIIAEVSTSLPSYIDDGTILSDAQEVPRPGNTLDNSEPVSGTYNYITTFKRCLVLAKGSDIYFSELNKPESFPIDKTIPIPSGGPITGLSTLSFSSPYQTTDEILVIFKRDEMWLVTGTGNFDETLGTYDFELKFLDSIGCANQSLVVNASGYIAWIDYRGIYMWNGSGKPQYVSKYIEPLFQSDGDLDKTKLYFGWGQFYKKENQIVWYLSHKIFGENQLALKLDLRLTAPGVAQNLSNVMVDAVFIPEKRSVGQYSGLTYVPSDTYQEVFLASDADGYVYTLYTVYNEAGEDIEFSYSTAWLDQGAKSVAKRYHKVIVYVDEVGDWDLNLKYNVNYNPFDSASSNIDLSLGPTERNQAGLWDLGIWDEALWDQSLNKIKAITYNLNALNNANEGDSIRLNFNQTGADQPVVIHGFSILYDEIAVRK